MDVDPLDALSVRLSDGVVFLDAFVLDDVDAHLAGEDEEQARRFGWYPARSTKESVETKIVRWIDNWAAGGPVRALAARILPEERLGGGVELRPGTDGTAQISYWVFPDFRQRRIAVRSVRPACRYAVDFFGCWANRGSH